MMVNSRLLYQQSNEKKEITERSNNIDCLLWKNTYRILQMIDRMLAEDGRKKDYTTCKEPVLPIVSSTIHITDIFEYT